jgi:hypothetical protein
VSGLVSQEPVLCSEVAMVVVMLGGTASSSSSSSREASGLSVEGSPVGAQWGTCCACDPKGPSPTGHDSPHPRSGE